MEKLDKQVKGFPTKYESFIHGKRYSAKQLNRVDVFSPITGEKIYDLPDSTKSEIDAALESSDDALLCWQLLSARARAEQLEKIAKIIYQYRSLLAELEVIDNGKFFIDALREIELASQYFTYFAACIRTQEGMASQVEDV